MIQNAKTILRSTLFTGLVAATISITGCASAGKNASAGEVARTSVPKATGAPITYFEIAGPNGPELQKFYSSIFKWSIDEHAAISAASTGGLKGGIRNDPAEKIIYLEVTGIADTLKRIEAAGGKTVIPRTVVPGVVTFAIFLDPAGNRMGLAETGSTLK